jgi:hypothetical protein
METAASLDIGLQSRQTARLPSGSSSIRWYGKVINDTPDRQSGAQFRVTPLIGILKELDLRSRYIDGSQGSPTVSGRHIRLPRSRPDERAIKGGCQCRRHPGGYSRSRSRQIEHA